MLLQVNFFLGFFLLGLTFLFTMLLQVNFFLGFFLLGLTFLFGGFCILLLKFQSNQGFTLPALYNKTTFTLRFLAFEFLMFSQQCFMFLCPGPFCLCFLCGRLSLLMGMLLLRFFLCFDHREGAVRVS